MKLGCYASVARQEQPTLPLQRDAMIPSAQQRGWTMVLMVEEISSGARERLQRQELLRAARRRALNALVVWRLDRWGRSVADLVSTLQELQALGVGFLSLSEALDVTTPRGWAMAGRLAIFAEFAREILRERVQAGSAPARQRGTPHGRPPTVAHQGAAVRQLAAEGLSQSAIARQRGLSRTSGRRFMA